MGTTNATLEGNLDNGINHDKRDQVGNTPSCFTGGLPSDPQKWVTLALDSSENKGVPSTWKQTSKTSMKNTCGKMTGHFLSPPEHTRKGRRPNAAYFKRRWRINLAHELDCTLLNCSPSARDDFVNDPLWPSNVGRGQFSNRERCDVANMVSSWFTLDIPTKSAQQPE